MDREHAIHNGICIDGDEVQTRLMHRTWAGKIDLKPKLIGTIKSELLDRSCQLVMLITQIVTNADDVGIGLRKLGTIVPVGERTLSVCCLGAKYGIDSERGAVNQPVQVKPECLTAVVDKTLAQVVAPRLTRVNNILLMVEAFDIGALYRASGAVVGQSNVNIVVMVAVGDHITACVGIGVLLLHIRDDIV